jgi:2TM domain-containing protein
MTDEQRTPEDDRRQQAIERLKKKRDFHAHLLSYVMVNAFTVTIWALTGAHFFWPVFLMLGWGIGLVFHARDVYWGDVYTEDQIQREMQHLR